MNSTAAALRVRARGCGRGEDQGEWAGVWWALRRVGEEARKGEVGALREEVVETEEESALLLVVGRTADMVSGVEEVMLRRKEDERETEGREGVTDPFEGRGGTGVVEGWRSSRWRWRRERMSGSR